LLVACNCQILSCSEKCPDTLCLRLRRADKITECNRNGDEIILNMPNRHIKPLEPVE
jgi:hypothetical protein